MKIFRSLILSLLIVLCSAVQAQNIVPQPQKIEKRNGAFNILTTTKITHYPSLRSQAERLAEYVPLDVREYNEAEKGNIVLREAENLAPEAYVLVVNEQGVVIDG
ncbi:MAG: hypothetical protein IKT75_01510, partial [Alistipes sp.]|nr:hypothetical protein [Alistipes sp.]